jgi:hypothetical protein
MNLLFLKQLILIATNKKKIEFKKNHRYISIKCIFVRFYEIDFLKNKIE